MKIFLDYHHAGQALIYLIATAVCLLGEDIQLCRQIQAHPLGKKAHLKFRWDQVSCLQRVDASYPSQCDPEATCAGTEKASGDLLLPRKQWLDSMHLPLLSQFLRAINLPTPSSGLPHRRVVVSWVMDVLWSRQPDWDRARRSRLSAVGSGDLWCP
jgi:hypothetical protein